MMVDLTQKEEPIIMFISIESILQDLRPCFSRQAAFEWFSLIIIGLLIRWDHLGLTSIVIGIALRIRAFMYAGVAFLILNVGAQLVQLYPEHRLGRAVMLIVLGIAITATMIGFNVKREAVLARVRIFRSDLETWA